MPAVRQASLAEGEGVLSDRLGGWGGNWGSMERGDWRWSVGFYQGT